MRHKYGYNSQVVNWGNMNELVPLGYIDTVPGETFSGSIEVLIRSQPTVLAVDTRAYLDAFAFYVPYRVLDFRFPEFVAAQPAQSWVTLVGGLSAMVQNLNPFNFETRFSVSSNGTSFDCNMPWLRLAYCMIWDKFFRRIDEAERLPSYLTSTGPLFVSQRPSTLEKRPLLGNAATFDTQIPLVGTSPNQTVSLNVMRNVMAQDRFQRMRAAQVLPGKDSSRGTSIRRWRST